MCVFFLKISLPLTPTVPHHSGSNLSTRFPASVAIVLVVLSNAYAIAVPLLNMTCKIWALMLAMALKVRWPEDVICSFESLDIFCRPPFFDHKALDTKAQHRPCMGGGPSI